MTKTYDVAVRKNFPLAKGETINQAMENLRRVGRDHVKKALALGDKGGAYLTEAFSNAAVFSVWKEGGGEDLYYAATFKRDAEGDYEFGSLQEVKRVTGFRPVAKPAASLTQKSVDGPAEEFAGLEGWPVVKKGLFNGVI